MAAPGDILCDTCRRQRCDDVRGDLGFFPLFDAFHGLSDPFGELADDIAAIAQHLTAQAQTDIADIAARDEVIRHLQRKLDLRGKALRRARQELDAERARADGLQRQVDGLQRQVHDLLAEQAQLRDLASENGCRTDDLTTVDTAVGDWRPHQAGYNVLYERVDPATCRALYWRWYRVNGA